MVIISQGWDLSTNEGLNLPLFAGLLIMAFLIPLSLK